MDSLEGVEAIGRRIAFSQGDGGATEAERVFLRDRLLTQLRADRRKRATVQTLAGVALGAAAAAAFFYFHRPGASDVAFSVDGAPGKVGDFLPSPNDRPIELKFDEGTRAQLAPGTRGRVTAVSPYGADVVIEAGRAKLSVVPHAHNRWLVHAGPFVVHVTGTKFEVAWDPVKDRFELELYEGKVTLSGCVFGENSPLAAGSRVEAGCGLSLYRVSELPDPAKTQKPAATPAPSKAPPTTATTDPAEPEPEKTRPDWLAMARGGRYDEAFRAAEAEGIDDLCAKTSAPNLLLLGDAARLSGHPAVARSIYLSTRSRFPATPSAASAAFYLGRLDLDDKHSTIARKWLLVYLDEAPDGPLAAAALGRLLEIQIASHDRPRAIALAKQYLDRYPDGPHSAAAERVLTDDAHATR